MAQCLMRQFHSHSTHCAAAEVLGPVDSRSPGLPSKSLQTPKVYSTDLLLISSLGGQNTHTGDLSKCHRVVGNPARLPSPSRRCDSGSCKDHDCNGQSRAETPQPEFGKNGGFPMNVFGRL